MMILQAFSNKEGSFVKHFYIKDHKSLRAGTYDNKLPQGHINPYTWKEGEVDSSLQFFENEKSRKYVEWDVLEQKAQRDTETGRLMNRKNPFIVDETENY